MIRHHEMSATMSNSRYSLSMIIFWILTGCAEGGTTPVHDASISDASIDGPIMDASIDQGVEPNDASADTSMLDSSIVDSSILDSTILDSSMVDSMVPDSMIPDSMVPDTGVIDSSMPNVCDMALSATLFSFDSGREGWSHQAVDGVSGSWPFDEWQHGFATSGPGACQNGACFATELQRNYAQCQRAELRSPAIDLRACDGEAVALSFAHWFSFWQEAPYEDGGIVQVSVDGVRWNTLTSAQTSSINIRGRLSVSYSCVDHNSILIDGESGFSGTSGGWQMPTFDISAYLDAPFYVRFVYASGVSSRTTNAENSRSATAPGWYIDNVSFTRF